MEGERGFSLLRVLVFRLKLGASSSSFDWEQGGEELSLIERLVETEHGIPKESLINSPPPTDFHFVQKKLAQWL